MKKIALLLTSILPLFGGCDKAKAVLNIPTQQVFCDINLEFDKKEANQNSKGFLDNAHTSSAWENVVKNITLFVYDYKGVIYGKYELNEEQISEPNAKLRITVPVDMADDTFHFLAVANLSNVPQYSKISDMMNYAWRGTSGYFNSEEADKVYNGTHYEHLYFPMSGYAREIIKQQDVTNVSLKLNRLFSKFAFQFRLGGELSELETRGIFTVHDVSFSPYVKQMRLFEPSEIPVYPWISNLSGQRPFEMDGYKCNLFYMEEGRFQSGDTPSLIIRGFKYDDQAVPLAVSYEIPYSEFVRDNQITRNTCYRVSVTLYSMDDSQTRSGDRNSHWEVECAEQHEWI